AHGEQLLDLLTRLRALAQPVERLVVVEIEVRRVLARAVVTDRLDDPTVTRRARVGDDDAVGRLLGLAHPHQTDLHGHVLGSFQWLRVVAVTRRRISLSNETGPERGRALRSPRGPAAACVLDAPSRGASSIASSAAPP